MNRAERRRLAKSEKAKNHKKPTGRSAQDDLEQIFQAALGHHQQGRLDDAEVLYRRSIKADPNHIDATLNLGVLCQQLGRPDDAAAHYRRVIDLKPTCAEAHYNLANIEKDNGNIDEAISGYQSAINLKPDYAAAYFNLGFVLSENGQLQQAGAAFRKVTTLMPEAADAYRQLASVTKFHKYDDDIKAMEALYHRSGRSEMQRQDVAFGLAKAFEDLGDYAKSFDYLAEGNRLKRASFTYATSEQKVYFERYKNTFDAGLFRKFDRSGDPDATPIFILGMPRSGTSLVEQILASHPNVFGAGELTALSQVISESFGGVAEATYSDNICNAQPGKFLDIAQDYLGTLRSLSQNARFITDKMPHNFLHIGLIKLALPNAKVIHCRRRPEDNCLSLFKTYFPGNVHQYACDLTELGAYFRLYQGLMDHWHRLLPGFIYDIHYEDLVSDQERQSRALVAHCGLDWDQACLDFHKTKRVVKTASMAQVRNPIFSSSVALWRRYEKQLTPLTNALNIDY